MDGVVGDGPAERGSLKHTMPMESSSKLKENRTRHPLYLPEALTRNCLLFDGLARAGKGLVAPLVSNLARIEYAQINNPVDQIAILWRLGLLDRRSAAAFLRITVDTFTYEQAIGRNLNTRISDISSIYNSLDARTLLGRTTGAEGQPAIDRFNGDGRISSFITHFNMPMAELWFEAFPMLRAVVTVRHPVDVIASWQRRGWGERWGRDPLGFTPTPDVGGQPVPWFAMDFAEEYLGLDPIGRNARCVLALGRMYDDTLGTLDDGQRTQVEVIAFERFATDPVDELERMAAWLGTEVPAEMPVALARERVPRELPIADRRRKLDELKKNLDGGLLEELLAAGRAYESRWGLEPADP